MRAILKFFQFLNFIVLLVPAMDSIAQSDSLSILEQIDKAEEMIKVDFPKAMSAGLELNRKATTSSYTSCMAHAQAMLSSAYWHNGEYNIAVNYSRQGIKFAKQAGDSSSWAKALNLIGNCFYYQAYYDSAIDYFEQSLSIYQKAKNKEQVRWLLRDISLMYHRKGDYKKTVEYILRMEKMNEGLETETKLADFPGMGSFFSDSLYYREKISDNLVVLASQLKENQIEMAAKTYLNLALANNQLKEYLTAARYYVKASSLQERLGLLPQWDFASVNYKEANKKDSAFYYHYKAKLGFRRDTQLNILYSYELLGDTHLFFNAFDSALNYYNIAMKMNVKCNNRIAVAQLHGRLADTYMKMERFAEAEDQIQTGIALANDVSMSHRRNLYKAATRLYSLTGDYIKKLFPIKTNIQTSQIVLRVWKHLLTLLDYWPSIKPQRRNERLSC